jgi:ABC-2 type transport system ATP-binding protein
MEVRRQLMQPVIQASGLTCRYGRTEAIHDLSFSVEPGTIFALLGPNGAGKTTTIRTLLNMLRPTQGTATVLGVESTDLGPSQLARIGYVSEGQQLPEWMTVESFLAYCRSFYPTWNDALCRKLVADFELPARRKLRHLSRGMRVKAALVSSLAYRPHLLILDEPFSGLDPVVRDDLVRGVLEIAEQEQWTVFLSSHDLDEVERLVDTVGFIDGGALVLSEPFDALSARFRRIEVTRPTTADMPPPWPDGSWVGVQHAGRVTRFVETHYVEGGTERRALALLPGADVQTSPMTLREIFIALARERRGAKS